MGNLFREDQWMETIAVGDHRDIGLAFGPDHPSIFPNSLK